MTRTLVIVEPGGTHEKDYETMLRLVDLAAEIGADVFKSQWTSSPERMGARRHAPESLDAYRRLAYPLEWHASLSASCRAKGLKYACTAYLPEDVAELAPFCDYVKVASFEARDPAMLEAVTPFGDHVIISTGMLTAEDLRPLPSCYALLACVSAYPTPDEDANLRAMRTLRHWRGDIEMIGYSDHTLSLFSGALAVAAGADVVEFHVRLKDCDPDNPDYVVARPPAAAKEYVRLIRHAEVLCGDGVKRLMPSEAAMQRYQVR